MMKEEQIQELADNLIRSGYAAVSEFLGYAPGVYAEKEDIERMIQETVMQMPEEELDRFLKRYCNTSEKSERFLLACPDCNGTEFYKETDEEGMYECMKCGLHSHTENMTAIPISDLV